MTTDSSGSLPSALHRYAGDPSRMKLRLLFTDQALLSSRPSFKGSKKGKVQGRGGKAIADDGLNNYHSSYLIAKRRGQWTVRSEVGAGLLEANGWRLSILSEPLDSGRDLFCCNTASTKFDSISRKNVPKSINKGGDNNRIHNARQVIGDESRRSNEITTTRSERAFKWKDTVSPDCNEFQRTHASKLPCEMRNHQLYFRHHCLAGHKITRIDNDTGDSDNLFSSCACLLNCGSDCGEERDLDTGYGAMRGRRDEDDDDDSKSRDDELPTDWYRQWLLNGNRQREPALAALSQGSWCFVGKASEPQSSSSLSCAAAGATTSTKKLDHNDADNVNNPYGADTIGSSMIEALDKCAASATSVVESCATSSGNGSGIQNIRLAHEYYEKKGIRSGDELGGDISEGGDTRQKVGLQQPIQHAASIPHDDIKSTLSNLSMCALNNGEEFDSNVNHISDAIATCSPNDTAANNDIDTDNSRDNVVERQISNGYATSSSHKSRAVTSAHQGSHVGEVLYIIMEKHDMITEDALSPSSSSAKTQRLQIAATDQHPAVASGALAATASAVDATVVSTGRINNLMDKDDDDNDESEMTLMKRNSGDKCDSKVQELAHDGNNSSGATFVDLLVCPSDRAADRQYSESDTTELKGDKLGNKATLLGPPISSLEMEPKNEGKLDAAAAANSNDKRREKEVNGREIDQFDLASEQRMQQEQRESLSRQRCCCLVNRHNHNDSKLVCLAVIVIDVLKRFIQMKPDLNKLISVDISTTKALHLGARFYRANHDASAAADGANQASGENVLVGRTRDNQSSRLLLQANQTSDLKPTTPIHSLLYQLRPVPEDLAPAAAAGRAEAERLLADLMQRHLGASALLLQPELKPAAGLLASFAGPVNGGVLIRLQFDIHFASEFAKDCRNLYVRYKLLANDQSLVPATGSSKTSAKWKLKRHWPRVKDETSSARILSSRSGGEPTSMADRDRSEKLAQMTHCYMATQQTAFSPSSSRFSLPSPTEVAGQSSLSSSHASRIVRDDEPRKSKGTESINSARQTADNNNQRHRSVDADETITAMTNGPDTCLLQGSTITSRPDSRGRFHFACVEELLLEFVVANDNNKCRARATAQRPASSCRPQKSFEGSVPTAVADTDEWWSKTNAGGLFSSVTDKTLAPASLVATRPLAQLSDAREMFITETAPTKTTRQDSSSGYESDKPRATNEAHSNSPDLDQLRGNDQLSGAREVPSSGEKSACNESPLSSSSGRSNYDRANDNFEIVLLLELYSSDFYIDKLQGWTHLSIPVCLDRTTARPQRQRRQQQQQQQPGTTTRHELPVIRPTLHSLMDKLRYHMIGQLPASNPSTESVSVLI